MKKITLVVSLILVACLVFTACGKKAEPVSESQSAPSSNSESSEAQSQEASSESESEEANGSDIAVFAAEMQEMLATLSEVYGDAINIEISTKGDNTLIITYTLLDDSLGLTAEAITESMESQGSSMNNLASQMEAGGIPSPVVNVKWIGTDGSELFNQEYK